MKPKRKPKNKNLNIDEQIEHLLDDDEYIIWSERTQKHYFDFSLSKMKKVAFSLGALFTIAFVSSLFLNPRIFSGIASLLLSLSCLAMMAFPGVLMYTNANVRKFLNYVNVVTNYQILVYDPIEQDVVYAFEHDTVQRFMVREYGDNIGNIIVDRRSDHKAKYRVTPTYPLEFSLRGINDLSKITDLLRSQLGIEPDYLQIHQKPKT